MRDRRSAIVPPEMTNGSRSGSTSSNSSARAIRIGQKVEEMQLAAASLEFAIRFTLQHHSDQPVARVEDQRVDGPLCPRTVSRRIFLERQLKKRVQLDRGAAARRVFDDQAPGVDVAGAAKAAVRGGRSPTP